MDRTHDVPMSAANLLLRAGISPASLPAEFRNDLISSVTDDSRRAGEGCCFVAVAGAKSDDLSIETLAISSVALAVSAISQVDEALESVGSLRSSLGAFQNRLEFTVSTLAIQEENAAASESQIRDADIAQETIKFTRNQILVSAGTSILAQANVTPQAALQLLG